MRDEYDLSALRPRKNPYARRLKRQVTLRLGEDVIAWFQGLAEESGLPYQQLIDLYLRDCMANQRHLKLHWEAPG